MNATLARLTRLAADLSRETDARLLDCFLAGSQPAFRELVGRHGPLVFGVCNRVLRHRQDAEDAFQAVFLVLARRAADVWPRDAVGSWLYGVAHRVALKARAIRARRRGREQPLEEVARPDVTPLEPDTAEAIDRVVRKLPEVYRAAVVACDLEGLSRKDAAGQLGWTEGTLSGRLARARKLLADRLRKAGVTLPVAGLAAVLGTAREVRAGLTEAVIQVATGDAAGGVPAPVATLTEGVVPSMFAFKLKALAAGVVVACTLGYGAWAAGSGDGQGSGVGKGPGLPPSAAGKTADKNPPDLTATLEELARVEQELVALLLQTGPLAPPKDPDELARRLELLRGRLDVARKLADRAQAEFDKARGAGTQPVPKPPPALEPLQGRWRAVGITVAGSKEVPLSEKDHFPEFEISGNSLLMPYRDASSGWRHEKYTIAADPDQNPRTIDLIAPGKPVGKGIYVLTGPAQMCASCHKQPFDVLEPTDLVQLCTPAMKHSTGKQSTGLRLAIATTGPRPTKFGSGAEGVVEFRLERADGKDDERAKLEQEKERIDAFLRAMGRAGDTEEVARLRTRKQLLQAKLDEDMARADVEVARASLAQARAQAEVAQAHLAQAVKNLEAARTRLVAVEKAAGAKNPLLLAPGKDGEAFTVHVRPLAAAEKVIHVKATGKETVLEGLAYAAEDMAIKPDAVSVWVVRDKTILPVDLASITQKGDARTNYALKAGDQLFVQVKVSK
jgi:RNA polymerase sigma factor (sigma-70 family)